MNLSVRLTDEHCAYGNAARLRPGAAVVVTAPGRRDEATIRFLLPVLDLETRLIPAIATLDNQAGRWRVGETVNAEVALPLEVRAKAILVPQGRHPNHR